MAPQAPCKPLRGGFREVRPAAHRAGLLGSTCPCYDQGVPTYRITITTLRRETHLIDADTADEAIEGDATPGGGGATSLKTEVTEHVTAELDTN